MKFTFSVGVPSRLSARLNLTESGSPFGCPRILGYARRSTLIGIAISYLGFTEMQRETNQAKSSLTI